MNNLKYIDGGKKKFHEKDLRPILPKNYNQTAAYESFLFEDQNLVMMGSAGTGKTFLAMYMGLKEVLCKETSFEKIVVVRSAVPVRDVGFLPGTEEEKTEIYELPYVAICEELFEYSKAWENLKGLGLADFMSTSYIRGVTLTNAIVIVDECQSLTAHELDSIITRLGHNSKIIFCGDYIQTDLTKSKDRAGLHGFLDILNSITKFTRVNFEEADIVRSGLVKDYIIQRNKIGLSC